MSLEPGGSHRQHTSRLHRHVGRPLGRPGPVRTALDHIVARGPVAVGAALAGALLVLAGIATLLRLLFDPSKPMGSELWQSFTRLFDSSSYGNDTSTVERVLGVVLIFIGLIGSAVLLAIVVTVFQDAIDRVRNGRTPVPRRPDTVILGWSHEIHTLIGELHASPIAEPVVAVLSRHPRVWMDESLARTFGHHRHRLHVHCRTGDRTDPADLDLVGIGHAERILVLTDPDASAEGDLIKTVFALRRHGVDASRQRIIVEVDDAHHGDLLTSVFGGDVEVVAAHDVLAHVLTQSMRAKGIGQIFEELTSYQDADFYEQPLPGGTAEATFGEVLVRCTNAIPVAVIRGGDVVLLPAMDDRVAPGDRLVVVAHDNAPLELGPPATAPVDVPVAQGTIASIEWPIQRILLIGWNPLAGPVLTELSASLDDASTIDVIADASAMSDHERRSLAECDRVADVTTPESATATLHAVRTRLSERSHTYDAVVIVPYRDLLDPDRADARSLLALAVTQDTVDPATTRVVCELRETKTATLVGHHAPDDLILSDALAASLMAQLTDRPWLSGVLAQLFDFHGAALFAHPIARWGLDTDGPVRFGDVVTAAAHHNEIAIGYRAGDDVHLAPRRDTELELGSADAVYVLGPAVGWTDRGAPDQSVGNRSTPG